MKNKITYEKLKSVEKNGTTLITTEDEFLYLKENSERSTNQILLKWKCECGEEFERNFATQRRSTTGKCNKCNFLERGRKKAIPNEKYFEMLESKSVSLVGELPKTTEELFLVRCECGEVFSTTYASMRNTHALDGKLKCLECRTREVAERCLKPFEEIKSIVEAKGLVLLSDESEYKGANSSLRVIGLCGHETTVHVRTVQRGEYKGLCRACNIESISGENNYNWKGGTYDREREKWNATYTAKKWRKDVLKRDNHTCRCCGQKQGKLNVHHLNGYGWCVEQRADVDNGATLCEDCHKLFHKIYGNKHNTAEQYYDFLKKYKKTG